MTKHQIKKKALKILKNKEFTEGVKLFDGKKIDSYHISDGVGAMKLIEFLYEFMEVK